jgi:hypothetical protein
MTIAIIEKQIAQTRDRLDRAAAQLEVVAADFKRHCYEWHVNQNKQSQAQIEQLRLARRRLVEEQEALAATLTILEQRKVEAQAAVARDAAVEHRAKARGIIKTLVEECAPALDVRREHPDGNGPYHFSDPPTVTRAGVLICSLLTELRALKLDNGATWRFVPQDGRETCTKEDARKELVRMLQAGWHYVPAAERRPHTPGRRQPSALPFAKMLSYWSQRLESVLREPVEQTNEKEIAA